MKYRLGDICTFYSGTGFPTKYQGKREGEFPFYKVGDIATNVQLGNRYLYLCNNYISSSEVGELKGILLPENTVVFAKIGEAVKLNRRAITSRECLVDNNVMGLCPFIDKVLVEYFFYLLKNIKMELLAEATTVPSVRKSKLEELQVDIPSVGTQREIVNKVNCISSLIDNRIRQISELDNLIKSRFVEMFVGKDYPLVALDDLALGKGEYGAQSASIEYDPSRPRYVRITDIKDDGTLNDDVVSSANIEDDEQYKLSYGDFMFARMGATVGKTYAYKSGNQIFAGYLIRYRLNLEKIMPEYLYAYTGLEEYKNWVLLNQSGAAQPGINAKKYGSLLIPIAPLEEQRVFVDFVTQVTKLKFVGI